MTTTTAPMRTTGPLLAAVAGLLFGLGLIAGGMTDPGKVQAFLDLGGRWDPSLAFVMGGALAVTAVAMAWGRRRALSWSGEPLCQPPSRRIEPRLVAGGVLFGAGWGLAGFCPGPAWVSAASGSGEALLFVAAMVVGMQAHDRLRGSAAPDEDAPGGADAPRAVSDEMHCG